MDIFRHIISRKFKNIAQSRYEEIARRYREFLLLPEELVLPQVNSILFPIDRFSVKVPVELFETLSAYRGSSVTVVYISEERTLKLVEQALGKEEAGKLKEEKLQLAKEILSEVSSKLDEIGLNVSSDVIIGHKADDVIEMMRTGKFDLLVISRSFGSEPTKTSPTSPLVLKVIQHVDRPAIIY